ncbi:hypothetical protein D3C79_528530 [compost metagenome]
MIAAPCETLKIYPALRAPADHDQQRTQSHYPGRLFAFSRSQEPQAALWPAPDDRRSGQGARRHRLRRRRPPCRRACRGGSGGGHRYRQDGGLQPGCHSGRQGRRQAPGDRHRHRGAAGADRLQGPARPDAQQRAELQLRPGQGPWPLPVPVQARHPAAGGPRPIGHRPAVRGRRLPHRSRRAQPEAVQQHDREACRQPLGR